MAAAALTRLAAVLRHRAAMARFRRDMERFGELSRQAGRGLAVDPGDIMPMLLDATPDTAFDRHYIYHTAWAMRELATRHQDSPPAEHVDVGSSLYFVALASAVTRVRHLDYRPPDLKLPGLAVERADLAALPMEDASVASLSCMHVVEHVGLGRYGDPLDPLGDLKAMAELSRVLAPGGRLLFVAPVGRPRVVFNAHRIYDPGTVPGFFPDLDLASFALVPDRAEDGGLIEDADMELARSQTYGCGCYLFTRVDT